MTSKWNFTPGRVALLFAAGVLLGSSSTLALFSWLAPLDSEASGGLSTPALLGALTAVLSGLAVANACRVKGPSSDEAS